MKSVICAVLIGLLSLGLLAFNGGVTVTAQAIPYFKKAQIDIIPLNPTERDSVRAIVTVTVVLPDPCWQVSFSPLQKVGNVFRANVIVTPPPKKKFCPPVIAVITVRHTYQLGKLPAGSYRFELGGCVKGPNDHVCIGSLLAVKEFQVRSKK